MKKAEMQSLLIGWTTLASEDEAKQLAHQLVESHLAVCVQIDDPVQSVYRWNEQVCTDTEWRLLVKFLESKSDELQRFIDEQHPYDVPEWLALSPQQVAPEYLKWAQA